MPIGTRYEVVTPKAIIRQKSLAHAKNAVAYISAQFPGGLVFARKRSWWFKPEWIMGTVPLRDMPPGELETEARPYVRWSTRRTIQFARSHHT